MTSSDQPSFEELIRQAQKAHESGQMDRSADLCRTILASDPRNFDALLLLGILAAKTGRQSICVRALSQVLEQDPNQFDALIWIGIVQHQLGEFDSARQKFEHALTLNPDSFAPYVGILRGHKATDADRPLLKQAIGVLGESPKVDDDTRQLAYGLAKAYNDLGEYATAIKYYDQANRVAAQLQMPFGFNRRRHSRNLNEMIRVFSKATLDQCQKLGKPTAKPIFILGMIRSGTTLVEQIISRHPSVSAGGEIRFWIDKGPTTLIPGSNMFNTELAGFLALEYLASLNRVAPGTTRVTDKMPLNYMLAGLIHALFPNAPIIHCRRNPVDTCLSIYMTPYAAPPDFAYDRDSIAYAYRDYLRIMQHWREVMPEGRMLEVDYESLVDEPEISVRKMIAYCGLDWDPACLSPERNERTVDTPSRWQVRQPIYKSSVGRSHHYAPWLGAIGELA